MVAELHKDQKRKGSGIPYVSHPYGVAFIAENYTADEDVIIASLLHDVLEDVDQQIYDEPKMRAQFGNRATDIVKDVTEDKSLPDWQARKEAYLAHLKIASPEGLLISAADLTHNLLSMAEAYKVEGDKLWAKFEGDAEGSDRVHSARIATIKERLDSPIVEELGATYETFSLAVKKP